MENWDLIRRTIHSYQLQEMRIVLFGSFGWTKARASVECGALEEVLPMKIYQEGQHGRVKRLLVLSNSLFM